MSTLRCCPKEFKELYTYLASRDFTNFLNKPGGVRPVLEYLTAGDLVRLSWRRLIASNPNSFVRISEFGVPISSSTQLVNSTTSVNAALAAFEWITARLTKVKSSNDSRRNSFYHGLTLELRNRFKRAKNGAGFSFRRPTRFLS